MQAPFLEKKQREELQKEAQRLMEMEEKIRELQRRKQLRIERDRIRRQNRVYYTNASIIQKGIKKFLRRKREKAVIIMMSFLRFFK